MSLPNFRRPRRLLLAAAPLLFFITVARDPQPISKNVTAPLYFPPTLTPTEIPPTATPEPPTVVPQLPTATPEAAANALPTPRTGPVRVGIQAGHWKSSELPDELSRLRTSTGARASGVAEVDVNLAVAQRVVALLQQRGIEAELLPATIPPGYEADAVVALHADGSPSGRPRGFKLATPWRTSPAAQHLFDALTAEYGAATKLPKDTAITFNMRGYYAFSWRRHVHAVAKTTPAVILEMGYLTNVADRALLTTRQDTLAVGVANGIIRYLNERDPNDTAALLPPDFKTQRPANGGGVDVRAAPNDRSSILLHVNADGRLIPFQEKDGWMQVVVRGGWDVVGWVRRDQLLDTDDPLPLPATDSAD